MGSPAVAGTMFRSVDLPEPSASDSEWLHEAGNPTHSSADDLGSAAIVKSALSLPQTGEPHSWTRSGREVEAVIALVKAQLDRVLSVDRLLEREPTAVTGPAYFLAPSVPDAPGKTAALAETAAETTEAPQPEGLPPEATPTDDSDRADAEGNIETRASTDGLETGAALGLLAIGSLLAARARRQV
ncbi:MAG: hypothetical protein ACFB9N_12910 [Geitlerinemataceae cyanobacterium]